MPEEEFIPVYIMNKCYEVPATLTIMGALEYSGYQLKRGCGCREGFCGACATVYRLPDTYKVQYGLACQTVVEPNMYIAQLPFFPAVKKTYNIEKLKPEHGTILSVYPEIARCVACNTCTKSCPQELEVMDYIQAALRGDIEKVAKLSFDCIMCGLCAARCPAEIVHYNVSELGRRLYGKYMSPKSEFLPKRIEEVKKGKYDKTIGEYKKMSLENLKETYSKRELNFDIT